MKHSVFDPYNAGKYNKSLDNLIEAIGANGYKVHPIKDVLSLSAQARKISIVHLNWFEDVRGKNSFIALYFFLKKIGILLFLKLSGKRIIWSMHNKASHESRNVFFSQLLLSLLVRYSYRIMIYSNLSRDLLMENYKLKGLEAKIIRVPHPNFCGDYGEIKPSIKSDKLQLLFLGQIRAYKNIELLIDVFSEINENDAELTIVGNPTSESYKNELILRAKGRNNIRFQFGFVDDEQLPYHLSSCDLLVLPLSLVSSLNSGTAILAFSYAKTIICPQIATVLDVEDKNSLLSYNYTSIEEHKKELTACINKAIGLKKNEPETFTLWGERMHKKMLKYHSKQATQSALFDLYQ